MSLETGTYIQDLNESNPPGTDLRRQGDDHMRLVKAVLKATLPGGTRALYHDMAAVTVASAATCDVLGAASDKVTVSGSVTITSFGTGANRRKFVYFSGAPLLTYNATSLITPTGADMQLVAGSVLEIVADASSNVRVIGPFATLDSPSLVGTPTAPTPASDDDSTLIATTAMVQAAATAAAAAAAAAVEFPAGTSMLFFQAAAPTGWTKQTTYSNYAIRLVSGSITQGGSVDFSTVFGITSVDASTLSTAQLASHKHTYYRGSAGGSNDGLAADRTSLSTGSAAIDNAGSGSSHAHTVDLRVKYHDAIMANKD